MKEPQNYNNKRVVLSFQRRHLVDKIHLITHKILNIKQKNHIFGHRKPDNNGRRQIPSI